MPRDSGAGPGTDGVKGAKPHTDSQRPARATESRPDGIPERITERDWQRVVVDFARYLGWEVFHFPNMQMNPAGFPDLLCFRDGRTLLLELKREGGRLGPRQVECIERLGQAGVTVHVLRPSQWDELDAIIRGPSS